MVIWGQGELAPIRRTPPLSNDDPCQTCDLPFSIPLTPPAGSGILKPHSGDCDMDARSQFLPSEADSN